MVVFLGAAALWEPGTPGGNEALAAMIAARPAAEVPTGHWAYRDLDVLARADLLTGVVVGGFVGATLTRSEVAWMIEGVLEFLGGRPRASRMVAAAATGVVEGRDLDALVDEAVGAYDRTHAGKPLDVVVKDAITRLTVEFWPEMEVEMGAGDREQVRPGTARFQDLDAMARGLAKPDLPPLRPDQPAGMAPPGIDDPASREQLKAWRRSDQLEDQQGSGKLSSLVFTGGGALGKAPSGGTPADRDAPIGTPSRPGDVDLGGGARVGAGYFRVPQEHAVFLLDERRYGDAQEAESGLARLSGRVAIAPGVDVFGEYLTRPITAESGAVNVGANVKLGSVEIGARYRDYGSGGVPALSSGPASGTGSDVDVSIKVGDFRMHTALLGQADAGAGAGSGGRAGVAVKRTAAVGLEYSLGRAVTVNADYSLVDLDALGAGASNTGGIGVGVNLYDRARVTAQVGFGGPVAEGTGGIFTRRQAQAGLEVLLPWNTRLMADYALSGIAGERWTSNASVGLGYSLAQRTSFLLGYRMIDFGEDQANPDEHPLNLATAELKIRF